MDFPPLDFGRIRTYPLRERDNKVTREAWASPWQKGGKFDAFVKSLPQILVGNDFRAVGLPSFHFSVGKCSASNGSSPSRVRFASVGEMTARTQWITLSF